MHSAKQLGEKRAGEHVSGTELEAQKEKSPALQFVSS